MNNFYEMIDIELILPEMLSAGQINRIFKEYGATLFYDVYSFEREDKGPNWQSESYIYVELFCNEIKVDAQEAANRIIFSYPLATIGSEYIRKFTDKVDALSKTFNGKLYLDSKEIDIDNIIEYCENCVSDLLETWGEEAGSKQLRIYIQSNYL